MFRRRMKDETQMLAFWLLPAPPAREYFRSMIEQLAQRFDAPGFEPHLTLYGTAFDVAHLDALGGMPTPGSVELEIERIAFSEKYTKTLFVQFKQQTRLTELSAAVARALGNENGHELNPHLSLIYKELPNEEKAELARTINLPFDRVRFDAMKAVSTPATIESREEVESWRTVWERSLS